MMKRLPVLFLLLGLLSVSCQHYKYPNIIKLNDEPTYGYVFCGNSESDYRRIGISRQEDLDPQWTSCRIQWRILRLPRFIEYLFWASPYCQLSETISPDFYDRFTWTTVWGGYYGTKFAGYNDRIVGIAKRDIKGEDNRYRSHQNVYVSSNEKWTTYEDALPLLASPIQLFQDDSQRLHLLATDPESGLSDYVIGSDKVVLSEQLIQSSQDKKEPYRIRMTEKGPVCVTLRGDLNRDAKFEIRRFEGNEWGTKSEITCPPASLKPGDKTWAVSPDGEKIAIMDVDIPTDTVRMVILESQTFKIETYPASGKLVTEVPFEWISDGVYRFSRGGRAIFNAEMKGYYIQQLHYLLTSDGVKQEMNPYRILETGRFQGIGRNDMLGLLGDNVPGSRPGPNQ